MLTGFDLCRAALAVTDVTANEQNVLLVLAIMADKDDATCFPPVSGPTGLTAKTKLSERAVQRAIQRLKELGHISRRQLRNGCIYTVHPRQDATPVTQTGVSETGDTLTGATQAPRPVSQSPKQPVTTIPTKASPSSEREQVRAAVRMLIAEIAIGIVVAGCRDAAPRPAAPRRRWPKDMPPPPGVSDDQWAGLVDHRRAKRATLTPRAYDLLVGRLAKVTRSEWPPGRIIDTIVERNWTTFEEAWLVRITEQENGSGHHHDRSGQRGGRARGAYRDPLLRHYAGGADPGLG